jgi:hypothetical protein
MFAAYGFIGVSLIWCMAVLNIQDRTAIHQTKDKSTKP